MAYKSDTLDQMIKWYAREDCKGRPQGNSWQGFHGKVKVADLDYFGDIENPPDKPWRFYFKLDGSYYFKVCPLLGIIDTEEYLKEWLDSFYKLG